MNISIIKTGRTTWIARIVALLGLAIVLSLGLIGSSQQAEANITSDTSSAQSGHIGYKGYVGKVERSVLDNTSGGKRTQFIVLLSQQADLSQAYSFQDQDQRGWFVYNSLRSTADRSQAPLKQSLDARGIPYKSFWAANMLLLTGDRSLLDTLSARADVRAIESNQQFNGIDDPVAGPVPSDYPNNPNAVEWGVQNVQAPQVWAMGFTGQNIVIANQDTGMRWSHNAIKPKYRGWNGSVADHNYNWWDAVHSGGGSCGPNTAVPCDDHGHGTHTTGTTVGDDGAGNQVGVSPGSKWIGCRNMNVGVGTPSSYTECFQFFLAPTDLGGNNPNPSLRPHVMNNSWGCPTSEGCAPNTLQQIVENTQASGIFVEASAGNSGSSCGSVTDPPAIYAAAFSTGAIDISNNLASFSSRGPVTVDGSNRMKPNISAPGVNVRSSTVGSDTSYGSMSGTSMAGPHVAGVVALLWSARPELARMITETKALLENTANAGVVVNPVQTCGGIPSSQIPNNSFGYGRVDALAAVNGAGPTSTPTYTVTGTPPTATNTLTPTRTPTRTNTPSPTATVCTNYAYTTSTGVAIVPGTTDIGNHTDDGSTTITLPFTYSLYGQSFTTASVNSNGTIQFTGSSTAFTNACLPSTSFNNAILAHWDDLLTNSTGSGIFTSVSGSAPNRIFNIEWRTTLFTGGETANFEIRLYEGQSRFDMVYGAVSGSGSSATVGAQRDTGGLFAQFSCNTASLSSGLQIVAMLPPCGSPLPTNTPTRTFTPAPPTNTRTNTRTNTATLTNTPTNTPIPTNTRTNTPTSTATPTRTATPNNIDAFAHFQPAGSITVTQGTSFTLDLFVNSGSNNVNAAQNYMTFTNSVLQVVNASQPGCVITSVVTPDTSTFEAVLQNEACNGPGPCVFRGISTNPGTLAYASGALSNCPGGCSGDFRVAQIAFCATSEGDAIIHWQFAPPDPIIRDSEVVDNNSNVVSNRALYTDYVVHVVPPTAATLTGHVTLQGRPAPPSPRWSVPVTLTLRLASGGPDYNYSTTTDAGGYFTVTAPGAGVYSYRVKNPQTLANSGNASLASGPNNVEMGVLLGGDANNDNCVNAQDFSILRTTFGKSLGDPGYDARADFNGDSIVNILDFTMQKNNFGICGAGPITITR